MGFGRTIPVREQCCATTPRGDALTANRALAFRGRPVAQAVPPQGSDPPMLTRTIAGKQEQQEYPDQSACSSRFGLLPRDRLPHGGGRRHGGR